jgi:hypothetical protein
VSETRWGDWRCSSGVPLEALTELLIEHGLRDRILSERQLGRIAGGAPGRRYGLVNRALKSRELVRVRRGLYVLAPKYRGEAAHPFAIAQALEPGSYVSFETALSMHGWIPESVQTTASVIPGRKSSALEHPTLGSFSFHPLALNNVRFLELVERLQWGSQTALVAKPLRALLDLVTLRKLRWQGMDWLIEGMRIDEQALQEVSRARIDALIGVYKQKSPNVFLTRLMQELEL